MAAVRGVALLDLFRPKLRLASLFDLDLEALRRRGIRGIILDLDNTLLPYGAAAVSAAVVEWARAVAGAGFGMALVTNNRGARVEAAAGALGIPIARGWAKPAGSMLRHAMTLMGTRATETAMIGDQVLTDVLAGNRLGLYTILVSPLAPREFPTTRLLNRTLERLLLRLLRPPPSASMF